MEKPTPVSSVHPPRSSAQRNYGKLTEELPHIKGEDVRIRKVLVLYVGGTIGMEKNKDGVFVPSAHKFLQKLKSDPEMHSADTAKEFIGDSLQPNQLVLPPIESYVVLYEIREYEFLIDSSNVSSNDWISIAKDIETSYENYNGFVILHGTDTLAYTSSALSFMLEGLQKPVILTGSQISIFEIRSDAKHNILSSLIMAGCYSIPEVCVFFSTKLFRGNRLAKISATELDAFDTPNYHALADVGINFRIYGSYIDRNPFKSFRAYTNLNPNVGLLAFFPTITPEMVEAFVQPPLAGLVIQTYGTGNIPTNRPKLLAVLKRAIDRGVIIVKITHCSQGTVGASYEGGKVLQDMGIISGSDMTAEAALTKLCCILGFPSLTHKQRIEYVTNNVRGELTLREDYVN